LLQPKEYGQKTEKDLQLFNAANPFIGRRYWI
jgi:hypothetical protein